MSDSDSTQYLPARTTSPDDTNSSITTEGSKSPIVKGDNSKLQLTNHKAMSNTRFFVFLCIMALVCGFSNGVLPSVQIYSLLPYGHIYYR